MSVLAGNRPIATLAELMEAAMLLDCCGDKDLDEVVLLPPPPLLLFLELLFNWVPSTPPRTAPMTTIASTGIPNLTQGDVRRGGFSL